MQLKLEVELPMIVEVEDYHDFRSLQDDYQKLHKAIRVEEIGCESGQPAGHNLYVGIVFLKKDSEYHKMVADAIKEYEILI